MALFSFVLSLIKSINLKKIKPKYILYTLVISLFIFGGLYIKHQNTRIERLQQSISQKSSSHVIDEKLILSSVDKLLVRIKQNLVQGVERVASDSVVYIYREVPVEGEVEIVITQDSTVVDSLQDLILQLNILLQDSTGASAFMIDSLQQRFDDLKFRLFRTQYNITNKGFCLVPAIGVGINTDGDASITCGARVAFWNRFGVNVSVGLNNFNYKTPTFRTTLDYRFPNLRNVSIGVFGEYILNSGLSTGIGLNIYLK